MSDRNLEIRSWGGGLFLALIICVSTVVLTGCGGRQEAEAGGGMGGGMPPVRAVIWPVTTVEYRSEERFIGSIAAREMVEVQSEIQGVVQSIEFQEGQRVIKGELLVKLDDTKLRAQLEQDEADLIQFRTDYEMDKQLFEESTISRQAFDQTASKLKRVEATMELRRRELADTEIRAPFAGVVGTRDISMGQVVNPQTTLTFLVMLDPVDIEFQLPERFVSKVLVGQEVSVSVRAWPGELFRGEVHYIAAYVDQGTRTVQVKARINNSDNKLKPGMFGEVYLAMESYPDAILVPETALFRILNSHEASLYRVTPESKVEMVRVGVGKRLAGVVQILSGLDDGDRVIVEGTQKAIPGADVIPAPDDSLAPYRTMMDHALAGRTLNP